MSAAYDVLKFLPITRSDDAGLKEHLECKLNPFSNWGSKITLFDIELLGVIVGCEVGTHEGTEFSATEFNSDGVEIEMLPVITFPSMT